MTLDDVGIGSDAVRTAIPAIVFAWAANLNLLSAEAVASGLDTRVKMRDINYADAFVAASGGVLSAALFKPELTSFLEEHYPGFRDHADAQLARDPYDSRHPWATYDALAPWLTERWLGPAQRSKSASLLSRVTGWFNRGGSR